MSGERVILGATSTRSLDPMSLSSPYKQWHFCQEFASRVTRRPLGAGAGQDIAVIKGSNQKSSIYIIHR